MLSVYKYPFTVSDYVIMQLPVGTEILRVDTQNKDTLEVSLDAVLWALVRPEEIIPKVERKLRICGTGHDIKEYGNQLRYINTFRMGQFLWFHAFEIVGG